MSSSSRIFAADLGHFGLDLFALQAGQALQAQVQDAARLLFGQADGAVFGDDVAGFVDQRQQRADIGGRPVAAHQRDAGGGGVGAGADQADDLVDVGDRDGQADQVVRAVARLAQVEARAPEDDLLAEPDEALQRLAQAHLLRLAVVQRQHVDAEAGLQLGEAEQLVQHHFRRGVALQLHDDAHAGAVALVAHLADALDDLAAHQFGDLLDQGLLVHLIGDFGDDDRGAVLADFLEFRPRADGDAVAAGLERLADAGAADDDAAGGEIRPGDDLHQLVERDVGFGDQRQGGVDDLAGVVRRDVGRHADGDAVGAVDQQVGELGRQDDRLFLRLVVVRLEIDGVLVDVFQQQGGGLGQPHLGVAHRRRVIAVDRAEIALPVDQRQAHGEALRHADHGVVDRGVAVRVVFTHHVADDAGRFAVGLVRGVAGLVHPVQDAPVHRLQPVAGVRQRARHDHAHGVIEVGAAHFVF